MLKGVVILLAKWTGDSGGNIWAEQDGYGDGGAGEGDHGQGWDGEEGGAGVGGQGQVGDVGEGGLVVVTIKQIKVLCQDRLAAGFAWSDTSNKISQD